MFRTAGVFHNATDRQFRRQAGLVGNCGFVGIPSELARGTSSVLAEVPETARRCRRCTWAEPEAEDPVDIAVVAQQIIPQRHHRRGIVRAATGVLSQRPLPEDRAQRRLASQILAAQDQIDALQEAARSQSDDGGLGERMGRAQQVLNQVSDLLSATDPEHEQAVARQMQPQAHGADILGTVRLAFRTGTGTVWHEVSESGTDDDGQYVTSLCGYWAPTHAASSGQAITCQRCLASPRRHLQTPTVNLPADGNMAVYDRDQVLLSDDDRDPEEPDFLPGQVFRYRGYYHQARDTGGVRPNGDMYQWAACGVQNSDGRVRAGNVTCPRCLFEIDHQNRVEPDRLAPEVDIDPEEGAMMTIHMDEPVYVPVQERPPYRTFTTGYGNNRRHAVQYLQHDGYVVAQCGRGYPDLEPDLDLEDARPGQPVTCVNCQRRIRATEIEEGTADPGSLRKAISTKKRSRPKLKPKKPPPPKTAWERMLDDDD